MSRKDDGKILVVYGLSRKDRCAVSDISRKNKHIYKHDTCLNYNDQLHEHDILKRTILKKKTTIVKK